MPAEQNFDERWQKRLALAKGAARANRASGRVNDRLAGRIARRGIKASKEKIEKGSSGIFLILLMLALGLDILEYFDGGTLTTLINMGAYVIIAVGGFVTWFVKSNSDDKFSIFNLLKGQLWKYLVLPLLEWVPIINVLPFWTGTVVMMWVRVAMEKKKLTGGGEKKSPAKNKAAENMEEEYA